MARIVRRLDGIIYLEIKAAFDESGRMDRQHDRHMDVLIFVLSLKDTTVAITSTG